MRTGVCLPMSASVSTGLGAASHSLSTYLWQACPQHVIRGMHLDGGEEAHWAQQEWWGSRGELGGLTRGPV